MSYKTTNNPLALAISEKLFLAEKQIFSFAFRAQSNCFKQKPQVKVTVGMHHWSGPSHLQVLLT